MIFGSVCSGIEAASVAWKPLGWRAAFVSEIEAFPRAVLKHHHPEVPLHGDFTTIEAGRYEPIDLLVGGTPCQSFSVAGLRGGMADERGNLALEYIRLAQRLRARWVVWENVPGVFSSNGGEDFRCFLSGLVRWSVPLPAGGWQNAGVIAAGPVDGAFGVAWRVLDAQFAGVPQRRRRVFVVGYLGDWRRAAAVLFERHSLSGDPPPRRQARERVAGTVAASLARCSAPEGEERGGLIAAFGGNDTRGPIDVATALRAKGGTGHGDFESETFVAACLDANFGRLQGCSGQDLNHGHSHLVTHALRGEGFDASEDGTGRGTPLVAVPAFDWPPDVADPISARERDTYTHEGANNFRLHNVVPAPVAFNLRGREGGAMPEDAGGLASMRAASGGSSRSYVAFTAKDAGRDAATDVSPTLRANTNGKAKGDCGRSQVAIGDASAVRRLTPRECERLQGFPDDYTLIPWRSGEAPDGPRYKALGNSMAVPVMRWIGERIQAVEELAP